MCVCVLRICVYMCTCRHHGVLGEVRGQPKEISFFPSIMWAPAMELGLGVGTFALSC